MIIATTDLIYGKNCEPLGLVSGNIVQSTNLVKDFGAGLKSLVGGELKAYTQMMIEARASAEQRMIEDLGFDSLAVAETVFFFEDLFQVTIKNEEIMALRSVGELGDFVARRLREKPPVA